MNSAFKAPILVDGMEMNPIADNPGYQWMLLLNFAYAIAEFEGFFKEGSISQKNNNPGNLRAIGATSGFRYFEDPVLGWERLINQILINVNRGLNVREFFLGKEGVYPGYAPLGDNDPEVMENYIKHIKDRTGFVEKYPLQAWFQDVAQNVVQFAIFHKWPTAKGPLTLQPT